MTHPARLLAPALALLALALAPGLDLVAQTAPPPFGALLDEAADPASFHTQSAKVTAAEQDGKKAFQVVFVAGGGYPNVVFPVPPGGWNLSAFSRIEVDATNPGTAPVRAFLRVDNPGDWHNNPWDTESYAIPPGETKTLSVTFGKSNGGAPGFPLDPSKVVSMQIFLQNPKAETTLLLTNLHAAGSAADVVKPLSTAADKDVPVIPADWVGKKPPVDGDWVQTLDENFDGSQLDAKFWMPRSPEDEPHQGETQRYALENVTVGDGVMKIKCEKRTGYQYDLTSTKPRDYSTGIVTSFGKWTQCYGYFEARMKLPTARGLWPAFWMMPDRGEGAGVWWARQDTAAGGMEIDILEHLAEWGAGRYNIATHWDGYGKDHKTWGSDQTFYGPTPDGWHVWGMLWEPGKITWYCDGIKKAEFANDRVGSVPGYLIFCVQMGSWATKDVDLAKLPDSFQVDYVHAWQLKSRLPAAAN